MRLAIPLPSPTPTEAFVAPFFSVLFGVLMHLLFLGSMVGFGVALFRLTLAHEDNTERFYRILALFLGAMIALGANLSGVGYSVFAADALSNARVTSAGAAVVSSIIPALAGTGLGFLVAWLLKRQDDRSMRVLCLVGMLSLISFLVVYALAVSAKGLFLGAAAVPNLAFVTGLGLVVLMTPSRRHADDTEKAKPLPTQVRETVNRAREFFTGKSSAPADTESPIDSVRSQA